MQSLTLLLTTTRNKQEKKHQKHKTNKLATGKKKQKTKLNI